MDLITASTSLTSSFITVYLEIFDSVVVLLTILLLLDVVFTLIIILNRIVDFWILDG
jgi:hypothetical protein